MKKILIINGHPATDTYCFGIAEAYKKGAISSGIEVKEIVICELKFNQNFKFGFEKRIELEPDLLVAWEKIKWSTHLVWVHPMRWGGLPEITKGFINRLFFAWFCFSI